MSKAFTRESDHEDDEDTAVPAAPGGKNYVTRTGYERLRRELLSLIDDERPKVVEAVHWAAGNGDRSENGDYIYGKKRLREIDRRVRFLRKRIEIAEVVDSKLQKNRDQVFFGATVTYADGHDRERSVRIVGVDEARSEEGEISWVSPVARALLRAGEGDVVEVRTPGGVEELEILEIRYPED